MATGAAPIPVLRVIARLNVGGPAIQVVSLADRLRAYGYRTTLLRGREGEREGTMDHLAAAASVEPVFVPGLRRELGLHDVRALWHLMRWIRRTRPRILHTHTAKAGALGRMAALLTPGGRPDILVHSFHGHVFEGEFSPRVSKLFALIERLLARRTTRIIAVSDEVRDDLVSRRIAPADKIEVIRLGFDLAPFAERDDRRGEIRRDLRAALGIPPDARVVTVIARVVKVKRIDRFLVMAQALADLPHTYFVVAGDGDRLDELKTLPEALALGNRLVWAGFQRDIPAVCFASDVVALTSDNEGTPVCLIEAQAAGVPVVSTRVGGVETVVRDGVTGRVVDRDPASLAEAVRAYLDDPQLARATGAAGRDHVLGAFSVERLVDDIHELYARLLAEATERPGLRG